jgi:Right handed beta helix region
MRRRLVAFAVIACSIVLAVGFARMPLAADDAKTLQALVDKGGWVRIPAGTYRIDQPIVVDLEKAGFTCIEGATVARIVMAGPGPAIRFIGHHDGTAAPKTVKPLVWDRERMPGLDGVEIVGEHPEADGVEARGTMMLTITRLHVRDCRHGIRLTQRNRNVAIADSHLYRNRGVGLFLDAVNLHQINVTGCHISYNDDGGIVVRGGEVRNLQITGCDIEANHGKDRPPTANVLVDSRDGSHAEVAITGNTIQHTHDAPGSANIRIQGPSIARTHTDERRDGHVTITGNILSDVHTNIHLDRARGVVVTGNTLWTAYDHNLLVENCSNVVVGPNAMDRNPRYAREETSATANAVVFRDSSDCTVTGLHLTGVRAAAAGILIEKCDRFHVTGCTVLDCEPVGLLVKESTRSRIVGCMVRDDRPGTKSKPIVVEGGRSNEIDVK